MPLKTKIGQLFLAPVFSQKTSPKEVLAFLVKSQLGNVIYFNWANDLTSLSKVRKLSSEISICIYKNTGFFPLIATDQEGGRVQHVKGRGFSNFPSVGEMSCFSSSFYRSFWDKKPVTLQEALKKIQKNARQIAFELKEAGVNVNLAPVVDVLPETEKQLAVIGSRSFSQDPKKVILFANAFIRGLQQENVAACLKHFPGYGSAKTDSHLGFSEVIKNKEQIQFDLMPFFKLAPFTDLIMTTHIRANCLDCNFIATFSEKILKKLLREKINFQGVVISDSLVMRAAALDQSSFAKAVQSVTQAAIDAALAGCDLLILSSLEWADFKTSPQLDMQLFSKVIQNFQHAVEDKKISEKQIEQSLKRILKLKAKLKLVL